MEEVAAAFDAPVRPSTVGDPCFFNVDVPGAEQGSPIMIDIGIGHPSRGEEIEIGGNSAFEDGRDLRTPDGSTQDTVPSCDLSVALIYSTETENRAGQYLQLEVELWGTTDIDPCDGLRTLAQIAFDKLPNA